MTKYPYILFVLLLVSFSSCQTVEQLSIDYMLPAEISFPNELKRVAIVNNVSATPDNTLPPKENKIKDKNELSRAVSYHDGQPVLTTEALAKAIAEQNYFNEVVICDSALRARDFRPRESTLSQEEVRTLTQTLGVDFIISLENLQMKSTRVFSYIPEWNTYYGTLDTKIYPTVKIYLPGRKSPMVTINSNDSIFWEEYGNTEAFVRSRLPDDKQMIRESSEFAGSIPVSKILPYWKTAYRYYFISGSVAMRDAAVYVKENEWDKASKLWEQAFEATKNNKKKMRAAFNLALYHEMKDSVEEAEKWAIKAQEFARKIDKIDSLKSSDIDFSRIPNYYLTSLYVNELKERTEGLGKLKGQMSRFNDDF
ncbi:DUF6340 family protein [Bacteroides hominis]|uniref:DUF6340 family protein n=1 Tax=Bacteroides hominis TaxID=2763023 RepID=UPI003D6A9D1B